MEYNAVYQAKYYQDHKADKVEAQKKRRMWNTEMKRLFKIHSVPQDKIEIHRPQCHSCNAFLYKQYVNLRYCSRCYPSKSQIIINNLKTENMLLANPEIFRFSSMNANQFFDNNESISVEGDCSICMDKIYKSKKLECNHVFCELCLYRWMLKCPSCPICRKIIM